MSTFAELEAAYADAQEALSAARATVGATFTALSEARCNTKFTVTRGRDGKTHHWYCTLEDGHTDPHSNMFSRGEAEDIPMKITDYR